MLVSAGLLWTPDAALSSTGTDVPKRPRTPNKKATDAVPALRLEKEDAMAGRGEAPTPSATKKRGRPRKVDSMAKTSGAAAADAVAARRGRAKPGTHGEEDGEFVASVAVERDGVGELEGSEAGALAWGLWVVGGLGTVMSAVTGAEVVGGEGKREMSRE